MRKHKTISLSLMTIGIICTINLKAQTIDFDYTDGTYKSYNLEDIRKITFNQDLMNLHLWDGGFYAWNVSTIGYFKYDESTIDIKELLMLLNSSRVIIYPNPSTSLLYIQFYLLRSDFIKIDIIDMYGNLMLEYNLGKQNVGQHQEYINIANLPPGNYICRISGLFNFINKNIIKL